MLIKQIRLRGFRNFKDSIINLNKCSLIIGENDIGKSNLLYAIRLFFDRSLSPLDIEPKDSDFYIYEESDSLSVVLELNECFEDCIRSRLKEKISDDGKIFLEYRANRNTSGKKEFSISIGHREDDLTEDTARSYLKAIEIRYISSYRDLFSYINREKIRILEDTKQVLSVEEISDDREMLNLIEVDRQSITKKVNSLNYVKKSTQVINDELKKLSIHNNDVSVEFDSYIRDTSDYINSLSLVSSIGGKSAVLGGDGRNNQIYMALWSSRNGLHNHIEDPETVFIYAIEEPEVHLHPHQKRKLARYLYENKDCQIIITTHSPDIAEEFSPNSIVRLCRDGDSTVAASNGCSERINQEIYEFGYRLDAISSESFFSRGVLLVEGPSEVIFYKALAKELDIDLDRLNISIIMVGGVGFEVYSRLFNSLDIQFVIRTDNDVNKVNKGNKYYYSGVNRCIKLYKSCENLSNKKLDTLISDATQLLVWETADGQPPGKSSDALDGFIEAFAEIGMFIAKKDLENDILNSKIREAIINYYNEKSEVEVIKAMQKGKATSMFEFVRKNHVELSKLKDDDLAAPLYKIVDIVSNG